MSAPTIPDPPAAGEPPTFGLGRIAQIAVPVRDAVRATAFYRDALGMRLLFEAPPGLAFFDADGIRLMLSGPEAQGEGDDRRSSVLYFTVKDLGHATRSLRARGVRIVREPQLVARLPHAELWLAFIEDGEGNTLGLTAEVPAPAPA